MEFINQVSVATFFIMSMMILTMVTVSFFVLGFKSREHRKMPASDIISGNILGLLSLILGFSFSMAIGRFERRRALSIEETNAISTAYLRSGLINFEQPAEVKLLFRKYIDLRIKAYASSTPLEVIEEGRKTQSEIWNHFKLVSIKDRGEIESAYLQSLNDMFDIANSRNMAFIKKLPAIFYLLILLIACVALGLLNFDRGYNDDRTHWRSLLAMMLIAILLTFIYDIDHSRSGVVQIPQDALLMLRKFM